MADRIVLSLSRISKRYRCQAVHLQIGPAPQADQVRTVRHRGESLFHKLQGILRFATFQQHHSQLLQLPQLFSLVCRRFARTEQDLKEYPQSTALLAEPHLMELHHRVLA